MLALVLILSGCTMIPKYKHPAAPVAAQYPGVAATNASHAADISWTNFFADERLKQLISLALTNNTDFQVAVLNVEQSRAQYRITRSASFPGVTASGGYQRSGNFETASDQWSASLGSTAYELDLFGRVRSLNRQALEKYFATVEGQRSAKSRSWPKWPTEYFTLRQAEEQVAAGATNVAERCRNPIDLNKATFDAGASSELDLRTAEGQVQTAKINVLTYERQLAQAENYLVLLIGQPMPTQSAAAPAVQRHQPAGGNSGGTALRTGAAPSGHLGSRAHVEGRQRQHRRGPRGVLPHHHADRPRSARPVREFEKLFGSRHGRVEFFAASHRAHFHRRPEPGRSGFRESQQAH